MDDHYNSIYNRKKVVFQDNHEISSLNQDDENEFIYTFQRENQRVERNVHPAGFKYPAEVLRPKGYQLPIPDTSIHGERRALKEEILDFLNLEKNEQNDSPENIFTGFEKMVKGKVGITDEVLSHIDKQLLKIRKNREDLLKVCYFNYLHNNLKEYFILHEEKTIRISGTVETKGK